jgi:hypothetical protein
MHHFKRFMPLILSNLPSIYLNPISISEEQKQSLTQAISSSVLSSRQRNRSLSLRRDQFGSIIITQWDFFCNVWLPLITGSDADKENCIFPLQVEINL